MERPKRDRIKVVNQICGILRTKFRSNRIYACSSFSKLCDSDDGITVSWGSGGLA